MNASRPAPSARRSYWPSILLAAAVVMVAAPWLIAAYLDETADASASPGASAAPSPVPVAATDPALRMLRAEVDALRQRLAELGRSAPEAPDVDGEEAPDVTPREAEEIFDAAEQRAKARRALFADTLAADPDDPTWSGVATQRIRDSFGERLPSDARLEDVSCRSTLCRITVRFVSAQAGEVGAELLPNLVPWDTKGIIYSDEREPTRVVFYAARAPELAP